MKYPKSPHLAEARACEENELRKADDAAWKVARDGGKPEDYDKYLSQWENGLHAAEARAEKRILESRSWAALQADPSDSKCGAFAAQFPQSAHLDDAQRCIRDHSDWAAAQQGGEPDDYEKYWKAWPQGLHAAEARAAKNRILESRSWAALQADPSVSKCGAFAAQFPQSAHVDDARRCMRDHSDWDAAQQGGEPDDYDRYLNAWPQGLHAAEARAEANTRREEARRLEQESRRAKCVETARTGLREELNRVSESISAVGSITKKRYFYRTSPNPKSMALCLNWTTATPFSGASGAGFSNAALAATPSPALVDSDAMYRCEYSKTPRQQCTCLIVHRNGGALLDIPTEWRAPCD